MILKKRNKDMPKYTKKQTQAIKHMVLDCMVTRMTPEETIDRIQRELGYTIKYNTLTALRMRMRNEQQDYLQKLRSDNFEYNYEFLQRIIEIRNLQRKAWDLHDKTDSDFIKINCIKEIHSLTKSLADLYDVCPLVTSTDKYAKSLVSTSEEEDAIRSIKDTINDNKWEP